MRHALLIFPAVLFLVGIGPTSKPATQDDFATWPGSTDSSRLQPLDAGTPETVAPRVSSEPSRPEGDAPPLRPAPSDGADEWVPFPGEQGTPPPAAPPSGLPPPPLPSPAPAAPLPSPPSTVQTVENRGPAKRTVEPNTVSLFGARPLEQGTVALAFTIGFPLVTARVAWGLGERFDLGLGFDTFYGVMNEGRLTGRVLLTRGERVHLGARLEAGFAHFVQAPSTEGHGARWLTGRRNYNVTPSLILSFEGASPRSSRFFFEAGYHVAFDTQPFQKDPLGGVPSGLVVGGNVPIRGGVEIPFSAATSFLVQLGFEMHGREDDSPFMPIIAVGMLTAL